MTLLQEAINLYSAGRPGEALRAAQNGLAVEPQNETRLCEVAAASAYALGDHVQAERYWRRAIALQPDSADTQQNLGILLASTGREAEAARHFRHATELDPRFAEAHFCLGRCLASGDQAAEAEASFRKALSLDPGLAAAHFRLGVLLFASGRKEEAEKSYRRAIAIDAEMAEAFNNLGDILSQSARAAEAEECFRRALALDGKFADAHFNLGNLLSAHGRFDESERCYREAIALAPGQAVAHVNLGVLLEKLRRYVEAEHCFRRAIAIDARLSDAYLNLGRMLGRIARHQEGEACIRQALALDSGNADGYVILGDFLFERRRYAEAELALRRAMALLPENAWLLPLVISAAYYEYSWARSDEDLRQLRELIDQGRLARSPPHALLAIPGIAAIEQREASRRNAESFWQLDPVGAPVIHAVAGRRHDCMRIGYLSAHFHDHPVSTAVAGVLEAHDRNRFAVHGYSYGPDIQDAASRRILASCTVHRDLRLMSDAAAVRLIAQDEIDILVDLVGYTSGCRPGISAGRPAPVIVNWLGYAGTLGHERLADYIIGDPVVTPLGRAGYFSETLALMPHCCLPYDRGRVVGERPGRLEAGLPEGPFVFCSFHQGYKLNPQLFDIWCRLLRDVPHSVLWLQRPGSDAAVANLRREAKARGIDPERLVFAEPVKSTAGFLGRLRLADLALDTHPYTAHSTGSDLLWAGVPLITKIGETFASRVAASLLHATGMPELVTDDWEAYLSLARRLALDAGMLAAVRSKLEASRLVAPLFDTPRFARDLEELYLAIWRQSQSGTAGPVVPASGRP